MNKLDDIRHLINLNPENHNLKVINKIKNNYIRNKIKIIYYLYHSNHNTYTTKLQKFFSYLFYLTKNIDLTIFGVYDYNIRKSNLSIFLKNYGVITNKNFVDFRIKYSQLKIGTDVLISGKYYYDKKYRLTKSLKQFLDLDVFNKYIEPN